MRWLIWRITEVVQCRYLMIAARPTGENVLDEAKRDDITSPKELLAGHLPLKLS
jgi:hypothetical protein